MAGLVELKKIFDFPLLIFSKINSNVLEAQGLKTFLRFIMRTEDK